MLSVLQERELPPDAVLPLLTRGLLLAYLDHLVLQRGSLAPELHTRLAMVLVEEAIGAMTPLDNHRYALIRLSSESFSTDRRPQVGTLHKINLTFCSLTDTEGHRALVIQKVGNAYPPLSLQLAGVAARQGAANAHEGRGHRGGEVTSPSGAPLLPPGEQPAL